MALQIYDLDGQLSLLSPEVQGCKYRPRQHQRPSLREMEELVAVPFFCLDLTPGHGDMLGDAHWELRSPWRESGKLLNTGVAPRETIFSSLARILESHPDRRYYLSTTACLGILRRAEERGKELPEQLKAALMAQAGLAPVQAAIGSLKAYHINQRDEGIDLGGVSGALMATTNMQMQTFVTGDPGVEEAPIGFDGYNGDLTGDVSSTLGVNCGMSTGRAGVITPVAFAANQRDEVRDLHDVAAALGAEPGMKQQTFVAGIVSKGDGDCFLTPDIHTSLSTGGGQAGQGYPCILEGCLNPWDTQQKRIILPDGVSPTLAGADGGGGRSPGGLLFAAAFSAGQGAKAGGIGYQEECAPTLKAAESGTNMVPAVLCLNDQGGAVMSVSEDAAGTLRAQEHGHQPLVLASQQGGADIGIGVCPTITAAAGMSGNNQPVLFENHGIDARYTGPHRVAPTISARAGTGGNNLPLVAAEPEEEPPILCITGNAIDRQPRNGGNGLGIQEGVAYTLTATDHHAVFSRQRVDVFAENDVVSTESARQHKDATDLVYQATVGALTSSDRKGPNSQYVGQDKLVVDGPLLIRRLTPLECERLQGFPDGWTGIPGASDSARYKALGNSVAIPCVQYIMGHISMAATLSLSYIWEQYLCWLW